jgi:hypothetical protein
MSAVVSPIVAWSTLRRVPVWRTIAEPLGLAVAGGVIGVVASVPALFLGLPPVGLVLGFMHLQRRFPEPVAPSDKKSAIADVAD